MEVKRSRLQKTKCYPYSHFPFRHFHLSKSLFLQDFKFVSARENIMSAKTSKVLSWYQSTADKRILRRHKIGPPDVHPQEPRQEEDNLSNERLRKGYQVAATTFEHDSLVFNSRSAKLDRLDEAHAKSAALLNLVLHRKGEINANLDKERRKNRETTGAQFATAKAKERAAWFTDLARGKALSQLAKKVPTIKRREEGLDYLCDYRIPAFRALWYLKVTAALTGSPSTAKQKKSISDLFSAEYKDIFVKAIKELTTRMWDVNDLSTCPIYKDRWLYISNLSKCAFEDGVIERQDFLNELCDIFSDYFVRRIKNEEKLPQLRIYLLFLAQFLRHINNNLILARRLAHMIAMKLRLYKMEYDEQNNTVSKGSEAFTALIKCSALRPVIHVLSAVLQNIVIDAPAAVIWNKFKVSTTDKLPFILSQLCGSPLDLLPCPVHELPLPPGRESERFVELLKFRTTEIVRRSQAVEDKWSFNQKEQFAFAKLVNGCLNVIGILDSMDVLEPNILPAVATRIFNFRSENWAEEVLIRIKLMLHWAVTAEREGSHRAIIVTKLIYQQVLNQQSYMFGPFHVQDIILNYFYTEAPTHGSKYYHQEFASLVTLFIELSRFKLFVHDCFVKELIKSGELSYQRPVMNKFKSETIHADAISSSLISAQFEDLTPEEPPKPTGLITFKQVEKDEPVYLNDTMSVNDRILIQMPLRQTEEHRSEANQRALVLYGMDHARENHKSEMKKIAKEICKIWQKKIYVQFTEGNEAPFWKQSINSQRILEILARFRSQTYYDQMMICGWCAESFSDMIRDFVLGHSLQMPTSEGLDIICGMFESAQYIYGIFELCEAVTPLLPCAEKVIRSLAADVIPGSLSGQLGYVFVAYICTHWHYFLHSDLAPTITNQLYELIERMIRAHEYPMTSWGRTIAAFVYHSKSQLKKSQFSDIKLHGTRDDFRHVFNHGSSSYNGGSRYNALFFKDVFEKKLRFFSYHEYKKRLPSFGQLYNRYSFVINSFIAAKNFLRDHDRLSDLAAFCGHISAQIPALADEWVAAIKALCCTSVSQHTGYGELIAYIDINDCSTHYPIATFIMLLAGKYAFSVPRLVTELLNNAFPVIMKREHSSFVSGRYNLIGRGEYDCEPGACLTLLILVQISCASDEPFHISEHYVGGTPRTKLLAKCADELILSMIHWCEMDNVLFPMLSNICILMDTLRARFKDLDFEPSRIVDSTSYRREYLMIMLKAVQLIICEEDWVTMKMFKIVETNRMEAFNHDRLKQNCLGQQLLRLGIRRRSEREVVRELSVCNGNSKKALIDKLLAVMNMWNMRATLFDLMLMIKEISPEGAQKHAQQSAIAADALMGEIGKCCRDLFTNAHKEGMQLSSAILGREFRFRHVTNFWLIALLVRLCPQPSNVPNQFNHMTVSGKFLKEAASMLDTANDSSKERIQQSAWLLSQQPFLNLVLACLKGEDFQPNKDLLVSSLYKQLLDLTSKTKENPALPLMEKFSAEREGLLLRLSLVGGIFKQICQPQHSEGWSHLFFQMMLYGMVSPDKDSVDEVGGAAVGDEIALVPKQWETSKTVLLYKKGDPHDIGNYRPICLLSVIYKLFTRVILNRIEKVLEEGQPCEQAGFRKGFSTIDHIHTVSKLIEVSREYKMPLCLTFIDLKKAFDSVETEAVVEALDNQGVPTQYIKVLRELYSNFTTGISPFYKNIIIDVKRRVRQGDTISPKIFTATLENAMRKLEWDDMGVKVDGRQLHHFCFADDIVLITPSTSQAERMLTEFDETCGCIGLQLNLDKTMFMRIGWVSDAPFTFNGRNISECTIYIYLGRELNMVNDLTPSWAGGDERLGERTRASRM
ncbi:hypothetical protein RB195_025000 [Necator americanus]|uniref:Reverse transcriptase domain-containing protein n=1 Tax=Necator americanus TaxID=51031 RepID=A0ABR1EQK9_NECAM